MEERTPEQLAALLAAHGLPVLRSGAAAATPVADGGPRELITALATASDGRLAEALIALFLRQPHYATYVPDLVAQLPPAPARRLQHLYTAAVYLQRLWRGTLGLYLGATASLPDAFGQSVWHLPAPAVHDGEAGLRDLAAQMQAETGDSWLGSYQNALSLVLTTLSLEAIDAH